MLKLWLTRRTRDALCVHREIYLDDNELKSLPSDIFKTNVALTYAAHPRPALCAHVCGGRMRA